MNIVIDCRMYNSSGVGVYLRNIIPFFLISNNNFILLGDETLLKQYINSNVKIISLKIKAFSINEILFFLNNKIKKIINNADIFYTPFYNIPSGIKIPIYTTIHDIIFPDIPELTSKTGLFIRMLFYKYAYKKSEKIFTVSYFSKTRIQYHLGNKKKIIIANPGIQDTIIKFKKTINNINKTNNIVYIGNIKKHKGLKYLLNAFISFINEGYNYKLILIGTRENIFRGKYKISKDISLLNNNSIIFTGYISDNEMLKILSEAALLVQPSVYEGFGIPPLEAMYLGTKVLISDIPVFKEIYNEFPVKYFKTENSEDLKNQLIKILVNEKQDNLTLSSDLANKYKFVNTADIILKNLTEYISSHV